jgi:hypothetical protein
MSTSPRKKPNGKRRTPRRTSMRAYVPAAALAKLVEFDEDAMHVTFMDGRVLSLPLVWFPRLRKATPQQRARYEIAGGGISLHWPELDEDLSIGGLLAGADARSM